VVRRIGGFAALICAVVVTAAQAAATPLAFTQTPPAHTNQTAATFAWTGTAPFKCSLDGAAFTTCTSPKTRRLLRPLGHGHRIPSELSNATRVADPRVDHLCSHVCETLDDRQPPSEGCGSVRANTKMKSARARMMGL
jgi:hypothetical protein